MLTFKGEKNMNVLLKMILLFVMFVFMGCNSSSKNTENVNNSENNTSENNPNNTNNNTSLATKITINATAGGLGIAPTDPQNKYSYFNFETGTIVDLSDAEAATSNSWDIAFKRSTIKLNGGTSGTKGVKGFCANNNEEAYDANGVAIASWFSTATSETEKEDFSKITLTDLPAESEFKTDSLVKAIKGDGTTEGWWLYNPTTHAVSANHSKYWVIRSNKGSSYAKLQITSLVKSTNFREVTISFVVQATGETSFADTIIEHTFNIPLDGGYLYYDLDSQTEVTSDNTNWDFKIGFEKNSYNILLNGGVSGSGSAASFGPFENSNEMLSGSSVPYFTSDSSSGIFVTSPWYAYNLTGDNKLHPNYRVYIINSETNSYKLQVLSYYHPDTTESAFITIRFEKLN